MEKAVIKVDGMSCEHCVKAVKGAVLGLDANARVDVDLGGGMVTVEFDSGKCTVEQIKSEIEEQGYECV